MGAGENKWWKIKPIECFCLGTIGAKQELKISTGQLPADSSSTEALYCKNSVEWGLNLVSFFKDFWLKTAKNTHCEEALNNF